MPENMETIILFGGISSERRVSVASAQHLSSLLPSAELWYWSPSGKIEAVSPGILAAHKNPFDNDFEPSTSTLIAESIDSATHQITNRVLYLGLHGGDGENGILQAKLEAKKIAFTGSSSAASALAMNKSKSKEAVKPYGVLMARQLLFTLGDRNIKSDLGLFQNSVKDIVIKPSCDGSSSGLTFISTPEDCEKWLQANQSSTDQWLAEERINGRELTVGVASHNGCLMALPPSEVVLERNAHFNFEAKYHGVGNKEITPALLTSREAAAAQAVALLAHSAIGCFGYTRTDMIMTPAGLFYLETNTLPGMTVASFIPQQLSAACIDIKDFISGQLTLATSRYD
jgi:D-alanine-D-alanine ligase